MLQELPNLNSAEEAVEYLNKSCIIAYLQHLYENSSDRVAAKGFAKNYYVVHSLSVKYEDEVTQQFKDLSGTYAEYISTKITPRLSSSQGDIELLAAYAEEANNYLKLANYLQVTFGCVQTFWATKDPRHLTIAD